MRDRFELARTLVDALKRRYDILQQMALADCFIPEEQIVFSKWFGSKRTSITFYHPFFLEDCMAGCWLIEIAKFDSEGRNYFKVQVGEKGIIYNCMYGVIKEVGIVAKKNFHEINLNTFMTTFKFLGEMKDTDTYNIFDILNRIFKELEISLKDVVQVSIPELFYFSEKELVGYTEIYPNAKLQYFKGNAEYISSLYTILKKANEDAISITLFSITLSVRIDSLKKTVPAEIIEKCLIEIELLNAFVDEFNQLYSKGEYRRCRKLIENRVINNMN